MNPLFGNSARAAALAAAVAATLTLQACGDNFHAMAQEAGDPYIGVWEANVQVRDCTTGALIASFRGAQVIHAGGTLSDTNSSAPASRGPGFGVWQAAGAGLYSVKFRFYRYNADGTLAGSSVVTSQRTLSPDGNSYTGDTRGQILDAAGNALSTSCVTDLGARFR